MVRIPTHRELADAIHVPYQRINELVNQKRGVTPSTALLLAKFFGVSAGFWLNIQMRCDLYRTQVTEKKELGSIQDVSNMQKTAKQNSAHL